MAERADLLETVPNDAPDRGYTVSHETGEFTFLYPRTGQPCFGQVEIAYEPADACLETMSLKRYLNTYRSETFYFEAATNTILDDLERACRPAAMTVTVRFNVRGGIETTVRVSAT